MKHKRKRMGMIGFLGFMVLILDCKTAVQCTQEAISLCMKSAIPSLFPFFVLSGIFTSAVIGTNMPLLRPMGKFCGIPYGMESLLVTSYFGGYPVGAQMVAQAWRMKCIPKEEAERLLGFCNNAGPSFLFGVVSSLFSSPMTPWLLWGIQVTASLSTAWLLPGKYRYTGEMHQVDHSLTKILRDSVVAMALVCGWIVFFGLIIGFLDKWILWLVPPEIRAGIAGGLELVNGCAALYAVQDERVRFLICAAILSFGGLCVMMQVSSVTEGLSLKYVWIGKSVQLLISLLLSTAILWKRVEFLGVFLLLFLIFQRRERKNGSIPVKAGV